VSFRPAFTLTNKNYRAIKTINFDGAIIDKLSYAALKGLGAELSNVTVVYKYMSMLITIIPMLWMGGVFL